MTNGTSYSFKIRAVNDAGNGAESNEPTDTPTAKTVTLSVASAQITEGNSGTVDVPVTITLGEAAPSGGVGGVFLANRGGAAARGATSCDNLANSTDYCVSSQAVRVSEGETTGTYTVKIVSDTRPEADEDFTISLFNATAGWSFNKLTITIVNDDTLAAPNLRPILTVSRGAGVGQGELKLTWEFNEQTLAQVDAIEHFEFRQKADGGSWSPGVKSLALMGALEVTRCQA